MKTKSKSETPCPATATGCGSTIGKVLGLLTIGAALIGGYSYMKSHKCQREKEHAQTEAAKDNMVNEGGATGAPMPA